MSGVARRRRLGPALALLLLVVPLVELYVLIRVGRAVGALPTIVVLVAVSLLGAGLLRREGARTWRAFRLATAAGRVPAREVADGGLVMLAGALLLTPGFVTDVFGLLLLLPPVRAVLRGRLTAVLTRRLLADLTASPGRSGRPGGRVVDGRLVDGSVVDGSVVDGTSAADGDGRDGR